MNDPKDAIDLHLYAQSQWHDEAYLVGNRTGLVALRDAFTRLLDEDQTTATVLAYVNDGEGYDLIVHKVPRAVFDRLRKPYTDPIATAGQSEIDLWPHQIADLPLDAHKISAESK